MMRMLLAIAAVALLTFSTGYAKTITIEERNSINFNSDFNPLFLSEKLVEIFKKDMELAKGEPLYLVLNTPGGSVIDGAFFIDFVNSIERPVHTVTIFAASMGYQLVQSNKGKRFIIPSGILMSHRASGGFRGEIDGEVQSRIDFIRSFTRLFDERAAKRVGITVKEYQSLIADEFWVVGKNATKSKHADEVISLKCGESLNGTFVRTIRTFFGNVDVEYSKCPSITAPIRIVRGSEKAVEAFKKKASMGAKVQ